MRVVERTTPRGTDFAGAAICLFGAAVFERYTRALHLDARQFRAAYDSAAAERRLRAMNKAGYLDFEAASRSHVQTATAEGIPMMLLAAATT